MIAVLFLILGFPLAMVVTGLFRLKRYRLTAADIALVIYALALYIISDRTFYHSLIPLYILLLALLLIGVTIYFSHIKKSFSYRRIFKIFWRLSFILTLTLYLALVIYILIFV